MVDVRAVLRAAATEVRETLSASSDQYTRASAVLPRGGSRSRFWWPMPIYVQSAQGAYVEDIDGRRYIDCNLGFGPMILGHAHPAVSDALEAQLRKSVLYGAACVQEAELAQMLVDNIPGAERAVFVNSGTEATMTAIRIARAATGRDAVAKFEGGWHGHQDFLFHSFASTQGEPSAAVAVPEMAGIPEAVSATVVVLPFNDEAAFERIRRERDRLACVIVEAVQGGAGSLPADREFLTALRAVCDECGVLLVLDEVVTGFRLGPAGAAGLYEVTPDLVTVGKVVGGGLPVGGVVGRGELIDLAASTPGGRPSVVAAGTFAGNPMTMVAGIAQLSTLLGDPESYSRLDAIGRRMREGISARLQELEITGWVTGLGSMWGLHFSPARPRSVRDLAHDNQEASRLLAAYLLLDGVLMSSPVHLGFLSTAHSDEDVDMVITAHGRALKRMKDEACV